MLLTFALFCRVCGNCEFELGSVGGRYSGRFGRAVHLEGYILFFQKYGPFLYEQSAISLEINGLLANYSI